MKSLKIKHVLSGLLIVVSTTIIIVLLITKPSFKLFSPVAKLSLASYNTFNTEILEFTTTISLDQLTYSKNETSTLSDSQLRILTSLLSAATIDVETILNFKQKRLQLNATINITDKKSTSFSVYIDKDLISFYFDEINKQIIYINRNQINDVLETDLPINDYIDAFFALDATSLFHSDDIKKLYTLFDDNLLFKENKVKTNKKATEYELINTPPEIKALLSSLVDVIYTNEEMQLSLENYLGELLFIIDTDLANYNLNSNLLHSWLQKDDSFLLKSKLAIDTINNIPNIKLYTTKRKLTKLILSNTFDAHIFNTDFSFYATLNTTFNTSPPKVNWLSPSTSSINLGSLDTKSLAAFSKKFTRKLYTLCLKYPELLEFAAPFLYK